MLRLGTRSFIGFEAQIKETMIFNGPGPNKVNVCAEGTFQAFLNLI